MWRIAALLVLIPIGVIADARFNTDGDQFCISSDGQPDHETGQFPNRGNPHTLRAQNIRFCIDATPTYDGTAKEVQTIGIAQNGVIIRPGTADYYDPSSPRGFSRDPSSGWRLDGMGASALLGLDHNHAHVDHRGLYHYHGATDALTNETTFVGWAADGFEIHYAGSQITSSYTLKTGTRPSGPGGPYDGTYVEDWTYTAGSGMLDECNGAKVNGTYTYFATDSFPYFPHCLKGAEIAQFDRHSR